MKKTVSIFLLLFMCSNYIRAQIFYNNIPDTVITLLKKDIKIKSYAKFNVKSDTVYLDIVPLNTNDSIEVFLFKNSTRFIALEKKKRCIPILFQTDFSLVEKKNKVPIKKTMTINDNIFRNDNYFLYKYTINGIFIGAFSYQ